MNPKETLSGAVPDELAGRRVDQALAAMFSDYSRSRLQQWINGGQVRVDGRQPKPRDRVRGGEWVELQPEVEPDPEPRAEPIPLDIVAEDGEIIVINKPAGLVVHPAAGNREGTLLNALLHHAPELAALPRAGIVHRLDKDTSGLMVVARTLRAHKRLVEQLQAHTMGREYEAIVVGVLTAGGSVDAPIGRHPVHRKRMAVNARGRSAVTHYRVIHRYRAHTHIRLELETGRTHQIRVHMAHVRYPVLGDPAYGGRLRLPPAAGADLINGLRGLHRQALHAARLSLEHPASGEGVTWAAALPQDMGDLLVLLEQDQRQHQGAQSGVRR